MWSASKPANAPYDTGSMMNILGGGTNGGNQLQVCMQRTSADVKIKVRYKEGNAWGNWLSIENNIPSFYKNFANISALSTGLGIIRAELSTTTRSVELPASSRGGVIYVQNNANLDVKQHILENWGAFEPITLGTSITAKRVSNASNIIVEFSGDSGNVVILFFSMLT